jgi:hypothetical protein
MTITDFKACPCSGKNMSTLVAPWILITLYHYPGRSEEHTSELQSP